MYPVSERVNGQARGWRWRRGGAHRNTSGHIEGGRSTCMRSWLGLGHMHEVMAGAGAHEGCVGCVWDGNSMLRGGWACQRGQGTSRGMGHVLGGHGATHRVLPSVGRFAWMRGWRRRHVVGVRTHVHKHGGHGWHDIAAAMKQGEDAHT